MDVISDIVRLLRLRSSVYFHSSFCGSWAIDGANPYQATFHLIARGSCWLHLPSKETSIALAGGDVIVFPGDTAHCISDSRVPPEHIAPVPPIMPEDETPTASVVCGYFEFDSPQMNPLLDALPDVLHIRYEDPGRSSAMNQLFNLIVMETENAAPGSESIVDRLSEILFIHILRASLTQDGIDSGLLAALANRELNRVITAVHASPATRWSVESLAKEAGMSRSGFAKLFSDLTGMTPMQYVTTWRMQCAWEDLSEGDDTIATIAERYGYQSEVAFRKAFKETTGVTPGALRRGSKK